MYDKNYQSVTSHTLDPPLSQTVTSSQTHFLQLQRDVLYGRPLGLKCRLLTALFVTQEPLPDAARVGINRSLCRLSNAQCRL